MFKKIILCICVMLSITGCAQIKEKLGKKDSNQQVSETLSAEQVKNELDRVQGELDTYQAYFNTVFDRLTQVEKTLEEQKVKETETVEKEENSKDDKVSEDSALYDLYKVELNDNPIAAIKNKIAEVAVKDIKNLSTSEKITVKSNITELTPDNLVDEEYTNINVISTLVEEKYSTRTIESLNNEAYSEKGDKYEWILQYDLKEVLGDIQNDITLKYSGLVVQITYAR